MKLLIVDEWGGFNSIRLASDFRNIDATLYILRQFSFEVRMPPNASLLPPVSLALEDRVSAIQAAVDKLKPDVILPLDELTLFDIWESHPPWIDRVYPRIDLAQINLYRNKHQMEEFARSLGLPVPETLYLDHCSNTEELTSDVLRSVLKPFGLPVVVKGSGGCMGQQVRVADTLEDAISAVQELAGSTGRLPAIQRFIDGAPFQVGGLFEGGRAIHFLAGEKTAIQPPRTGPAIAMKSVAAPELLQFSETLLSALDFTGIAGIDYIRDKGGRYYFLEVNPRVWGSYGFATALGIDLIKAWYRQIQGESLPTDTDYPVGITWAKMPEYVFAEPRTRANLLLRLCQPLALKSLAWSHPSFLLYQLRRILWVLRE